LTEAGTIAASFASVVIVCPSTVTPAAAAVVEEAAELLVAAPVLAAELDVVLERRRDGQHETARPHAHGAPAEGRGRGEVLEAVVLHVVKLLFPAGASRASSAIGGRLAARHGVHDSVSASMFLDARISNVCTQYELPHFWDVRK
jgi:hypothetical protein